jgi:hypothetical protein
MQFTSDSAAIFLPTTGIVASTVLVSVAEYDQLRRSLEIATRQNFALQTSIAALQVEQENQRRMNQALQLQLQTEIDSLKNNLVQLSQEKSNAKVEIKGLQLLSAEQEIKCQELIEHNSILLADRASESSRLTIQNDKLRSKVEELTTQLEPTLSALSKEREDCAALRTQLQDCKSELRCVFAVHPTESIYPPQALPHH